MDAVTSLTSGDIKGAADNLVKAGKQLIANKLKRIKIIILCIFIAICLVALLIMCFWGYIEAALAKLDEGATNVANTHEKLDNFMNGLGFQNSEEAFYEELNKLNKDHNYDLDIPLLMATLFYDDTHSEGTNGIESTSEDDGENSVIGMALARRWVSEKIKESNQTIGADGLTYSANKIYRLRKLARNQFDNPIFGKGTNATEHEVGVLEYLTMIQLKIDKEFYELKSCFENIVSLANPNNTAESIYQWLIAGDETFFTTDTGAHIEDLKNNLVDLLDAIFSPFFDISGISLYDGTNCNHVVCVKYKTYGYDEEAYTNYLKKYYVRYMPEFKKYINAATDEKKDEEIDKIIAEIKETAENYEDVFGKQKKPSEFYSEICIGNVKKELVDELDLPVDMKNSSPTFSGEYNYGVTGGVKHNGLDINSNTTGNTEGDEVYSVFSGGEVIESTVDETYKDKDVKGGWVKIKYKATLSDAEYNFTITYGGLSKSSLKLKKGDKVNRKSVIGKIGNKDESEFNIPSLHFGFYDDDTNNNLNPTNIFIPCVNYGGSYSMPNYPNAEKVANGIASSTDIDDKFKDIDHIAAILANLNIESVGSSLADLNPNAIEGGYNEYNGGIGISQWTNSGRGSSGRNSNLKAYASKQGSTWRDIDVQVKYLLGEYNPNGGADGYATFGFMTRNSYYGVNYATYDGFINATDLETMTAAYAYSFEGCGKQYCHIDWRKSLVSQWKSVLESSKVTTSADAGPNGGSSTSGGSSKVENYVTKMISMAEDSSIGYNQNTRYLNPNVDCSSFVYYGLVNSGTISAESGPFTTSNMGGVLLKNGFKQYPYSSGILKRGDIVVNTTTHTVVYIGDGQQVGANGCQTPPRSCSQNGDQADEVSVKNFSDSYTRYEYIYRLE